jgi:hypothetical protein
MKKFGAVALALILIIGFAAFTLLGNLDSIVEKAIEDVGTELTGTGVHLDGVEIDLGKGSATLHGLKIDNPSGYDSSYAFLLEKVSVALDIASLSGPVIILNEVTVEGARLNAEQRGDSTNLSDLLAQVKANAKPTDESATKEPSSETADVRLALKKFIFANTEATLISEVQEPKSIKVPDVRRNNIGTPQQGLSPEQLGDALLQAVLDEVQDAVTDYLVDLAKDSAKDKLMEKIGLPRGDK